jgi:hypothetical protein
MHSTEGGTGDVSGCGGGRVIVLIGNRDAPDICLIHAARAYQRLSTEARDAGVRYVSPRMKSRKMRIIGNLDDGNEAWQWRGAAEE